MAFQPDWRNLEQAARNVAAPRLPLYEHGIDHGVMEAISGARFAHLHGGSPEDRREYHRQFNGFLRRMGYDAVPFERGMCSVVQGGAGLTGAKPGIIGSRQDFDRFPFEEGVERYFDLWESDFELMAEQMPEGMKAVGGIGNGIFETVQDLTGYPALCMIRADEPDLYADLFRAVADLSYRLWERLLDGYGDAFAVCRFGDDLGFKSSTLLPPDDIKTHILPGYRRVVQLVHACGKPFLLHSCGCIVNIMEELIDDVRIDAKHSNEDEIATFPAWVDRYGDRIGNFGGIDMDQLCRLSPAEVERSVQVIIGKVEGRQGIAISSGNSIPAYVPVENYTAMVRAVRRHRGDAPSDVL